MVGIPLSFFSFFSSFFLLSPFLGIDGRALGEGSVEYPDVPLTTLVENYAFRYILMGDLDFNNPGNILFSRHSSLTQVFLFNFFLPFPWNITKPSQSPLPSHPPI